MATSIFKEYTLGGTLGVTLLGACVSSMLYGVTCLQTFTYYRSAKAKNDSYCLYMLVAALLVLDTTHQAVVIHIVYNYLVLDFANPLTVVEMVWSVPTEIVFDNILGLILNGFLTLRLWRVSGLYSLTALGATMAMANFGTTFSYAMRAYQFSNLFEAEVSLRDHGIGALSMTVATEVTLSSSLAFYLHTRRSGHRRSNNIITKLIALTITTGMLTALTNFVDLIAYLTARHNLYVLFFNFLLGKLYANAILTTLNSRGYILALVGNDQGSSNHEAIRMPPTSVGLRGSTNGALENPAGHRGVRIEVNRFVTSDCDMDSSATKFESV